MWYTRTLEETGEVQTRDFDVDGEYKNFQFAAKGWTPCDPPAPPPPPSKEELALAAADALITAQIRLDAATKLLQTYPDSDALKAHQKDAQDQITAAVPAVAAAVDPVP